MNFKSQLGILRIVGVLEAISWLALLVTMYLKYAHGILGANKIVGNIHGFLFIAFVIFVVLVGTEKKWGIKNTILALVSAVFPFATLIADVKIFKKYQD